MDCSFDRRIGPTSRKLQGIPDESKIGAFGVVMSGNQALAFV
jgi:hypothetical protein